MRAFVTGGAGFIGSNLIEELNRLGHSVYTNPSANRTGDWSNLGNLDYKVSTPEKVRKVDMVFHLGMPSSSPLYKMDNHCVDEAIHSTIEALALAKRSRARFVFASSSSLYNGNPIPFHENMPIKITDFYTEARYAIERLVSFYTSRFRMSAIGLRLFSVYGKNDIRKKEYANVVTQFAWNMINGKMPVLYKLGKQSRDFVHVDDVVRAFILASELDVVFDIFNVGTGESFSFNEVVDIVNKTLNTHITPIYTDKEIHNYVFDTLADTRHARGLGFVAEHRFRERFPEYVNELRRLNDAEEFMKI